MSNEHETIHTWRCAPLGEAALLVEGAPADAQASRRALALAQACERRAPPGVLALVPGMASLLIRFDPLRTTHARLEALVRALLAGLEPLPPLAGRLVTIPVVYGGAGGPDLEDVAARLGLAPRELVAEHCAPTYTVLMLGFAPGFPYLGGLPPRLALARRATPRAAVPPGSVAIAGEWSGVYPARLPGGWHLLGRTELALFDPRAAPPSALSPGDRVRFVALPEGLQP